MVATIVIAVACFAVGAGLSYLVFRPYLKKTYERPAPTAKHTTAIAIVNPIVIKLYK